MKSRGPSRKLRPGAGVEEYWNDPPGSWNVWWTLTVIAFTLAVVVLEGLGVFRDLGLFLTGLGLVLGLLFELTAATRT